MKVQTAPEEAAGRPVTVREAALADAVEITRLLRRLGLEFPSDPDAPRRIWERLWINNPAWSPGSPIGWVMESEHTPVGFFGTIPMRYRMKDRTLVAAVASSWAVEKPFRSHTDELAQRYFDQPRADMLLVTTAIKPTARIFARYGGVPMPQPTYAEVLFWVLDAAGFLRAALRRKQTHSKLAVAASILAAPAMAAVIGLKRHRAGRRIGVVEPEMIALADVGDDFDELWQRKGGEGRLYASREAADLRWHFGPHAEAGTLTILRCRRGGQLEGYLVMIREEVKSIGLIRAKILDLFVAGDESVVVEGLLSAAIAVARNGNCHVLEAVGFPATVRTQLCRHNPFTRRFSSFPVHYIAHSPQLRAALQVEEAWYTSLYDGDSSLF
ncbi:MAG: hypothetical protein WKF55_07395 [Gemmatimonadaceae bacterium]